MSDQLFRIKLLEWSTNDGVYQSFTSYFRFQIHQKGDLFNVVWGPRWSPGKYGAECSSLENAKRFAQHEWNHYVSEFLSPVDPVVVAASMAVTKAIQLALERK